MTGASAPVVSPEGTRQPLSRRSSPAERAAAKTLAEWLALEPRAARVALAASLAMLTTPGAEAPSALAGRSSAGRGEGSGGGSGGSSSTEGHSSAPTPGPGPGGSGGGSSAGGGAASGSSAATTLVAVYIKIPVSVMLRLGVSARSPRQTFFVLIPEKPD